MRIKAYHIKYNMLFKQWLINELKFDPTSTHLKKWNDGHGRKPYLSHSYSLKVNQNGEISDLSPEDWNNNIPHYSINPNAKQIELQRLSPITPEFRKLIQALKSKYHDIETWEVHIYSQAGHMQTGNKNFYRTVDYWMRQKPVNLNNKLPEYFYHGTCTNLWYESIKKNGLLPRNTSNSSGSYGSQNISSLSKGNLVYLSVHPDAATREAAKQASNKHGGKPLILRINAEGLMPEKLINDEDARRAITAQDSIKAMSTAGYQGKIAPSIVTPFLLSINKQWTKFKDVPIEEHPLTIKLRNGEIPYYNDIEYYILKDAGIIKEIETHDKNGFTNRRTVKTRDVADEEIKSLLKRSSWAQNVRFIVNDLNEPLGVIYSLRNKNTQDLTPKQEYIIQLLVDSKLLYREKSHFSVNSWNAHDNAIEMAKSMGKMTFQDLAAIIKSMKDI